MSRANAAVNPVKAVSMPGLDLSVRSVTQAESKIVTTTEESSLHGKKESKKKLETPFSASISVSDSSLKEELRAIGVEHDNVHDITIVLSKAKSGLAGSVSYVSSRTEKYWDKEYTGSTLTCRAGEEYAPYCRATEDQYEEHYRDVEKERTVETPVRKEQALKGAAFTAVYSGVRNAAATGDELAKELLAFMEKEHPSEIVSAKSDLRSRIETEITKRLGGVDELRQMMEQVSMPGHRREGAAS